MARIRGGEAIHEGAEVHKGAGIPRRHGVRNGHKICKGKGAPAGEGTRADGARAGKGVAAGDGVPESYGVTKGRGVAGDRGAAKGREVAKDREVAKGGGIAEGREVPFLVGSWLAASLVLLVFNFLPPTWLGVALGFGLLGASLAVGLRASRSPGWSDRHRLAVAAGAVTVTAPFAFVVGEFVGATEAVDLVGHGLFALVAAGLLAWGFRRQAGEDMAGASGWHGRP